MLTVLEDINLNWQFNSNELERFRKLWADEISLEDIAKDLKRQPLEVGLLVIDQAEKKKIKKRKYGVFGQ